MKKEKIKTLLLGLGRIASTLEKDKLRYHPCTHAGVILGSALKNRFDLKGIYDTNSKKIYQFLYQWNIPKEGLVTNLSDIIKSKFDLCVIATNSESHYENIIFAIEAKIPNLLVEKPACLNLTEIKQLLEKKKQAKTRIWVNHERRYHPLYGYVKKIISEKKYGKLKTVKMNVFTSTKGKKKTLLHDGTHALDYIQWVLGKPFNYYNRASSNPKEDRFLSLMEYPNDVFAFLEVGDSRNYFQFEIEFQTTQARFVLSNDGSKIFISQKSDLYEGFFSLKEINLPVFSKSNLNPWINLYREITDVIDEKSKIITGPIEDSHDIFEMIETINLC